MDEGRKRVLLIAASILAARKLAQYEGGVRVPATISAIVDAIRSAEKPSTDGTARLPLLAVFSTAIHTAAQVEHWDCAL